MVNENSRYKAIGWMPIVNGHDHPEIFAERQDAIARAIQMCELAQLDRAYIEVKMVNLEIPLDEITEYTEIH
jgi:hypothetical protein